MLYHKQQVILWKCMRYVNCNIPTGRLVALISYNIHSDHMNYGAALHSFAFQQYLYKYGIRSIIIDYYPKMLEGRNIKYPFLNFLRIWHIRTFVRHQLNWLRGFFSNIRKYKKFERFFELYTKKTKKCFSHVELMTATSIEGLPIDTFVCESDVIWKLYSKYDFNDVFFLNFPSAENKRKVAYSPSLGARTFDKEEERMFVKLISDFAGISTRERQGANYIKELTGRNVDWVLDPTLLLNDDDYDKIATAPKEHGYILLYNCMVNDHVMIREAESFAKKRGKRLIEISNWSINKMKYNHTVKTDVGIEEFLGYMKYADFVICNAFHGFCFSVIYRRPVFLFQRDSSDYRMKNITDALGLSDRMIPYYDKHIPVDIKDIDYDAVYKLLENHRNRSYNFINKYIITPC